MHLDPGNSSLADTQERVLNNMVPEPKLLPNAISGYSSICQQEGAYGSNYTENAEAMLEGMYLAHLEPVPQLAFEACVCTPPGRRHTGLEGGSQLPLLGAQLSHVIQIGTQAGRSPWGTVRRPLPQWHRSLAVLQGSQRLNDFV